MAERVALILAALIAGAAIGSAPAQAGAKQREAELARLVALLPGTYDNREQVEAERSAGRTTDTPVRLVIVRIYAPFISWQTFYVREAALDDERRVFSQRIWSFELGRDKRLWQRSFTLREPQRWRDGHVDPDLFKAMMVQDVQPEDPGCALAWRAEGARFLGRGDAGSCRRIGPQGAPLRIEERRELGPDELAMATLAYDDARRPVGAQPADPFLRLRRR